MYCSFMQLGDAIKYEKLKKSVFSVGVCSLLHYFYPLESLSEETPGAK